MIFRHWSDQKEKEIVKGFHGRFVHTDNITFANWRIEAGSALPSHSHPQEQVSHMTEGKFEMTINGETRILEPGQIAVIPGGIPHWGKALTDCKMVDVFCPVREDYKF